MERQVYYDTDGILENQTQTFISCDKCSGISTIDSQSDGGYHIYAITIPRDGCPRCVDRGHKIYKDISSGNYTNIYLQDRVNDAFAIELDVVCKALIQQFLRYVSLFLWESSR